MEKFYELLSKNGVSDYKQTYAFAYKQPISEVVKLYEKCSNFLTSNPLDKKDYKIFDFAANYSLSGGPFPCFYSDCRIKKAVNFSKFAALYADSVLIPNFFSDFHHKKVELKDKLKEQFFREEFVGNISVYLILKPLIESGVVRINPGVYRLCKNCAEEVFAKQKPQEEKIEKIEGELTSLLSKKLKYKLDLKNALIITGSEKYLEHGSQVIRFAKLPSNLDKYSRKTPYTFSERETEKNDLPKFVFSHWFRDLSLQRWSLFGKNLTYLTDSQIEKDIICKINKNDDKNLPIFTGEEPTYSLPLFDNINIKKALKLRKEEYESFQLFQLAIKKALDEAKTQKSQKLIQEVFQEIALPEVIKLDNFIKQNKKHIIDNIKTEALYNASLITVGYISSWFTDWSLDFLKIVGGTFLLKDFVEDISKYLRLPLEAKASDYYFLWKLKNSPKIDYRSR